MLNASRHRNIVVLTGAGVSAASGLRTYRGPDGLWNEHDVYELGTAEALAANPAGTWKLYGGMRAPVLAAQPNAAHIALANFQASLGASKSFTLITQNVDGLHQRAGSQKVVELHGNITKTRCSNTACALEPFDDANDYSQGIPHCPKCASPLRPAVVLFHEMLPAFASWQAKKALRDCDLFVAIGTSGTVAPASDFVRSAEYAGARTVFINLEPLSSTARGFQEQHLGRAEELVPKLFSVPGTRAFDAGATA